MQNDFGDRSPAVRNRRLSMVWDGGPRRAQTGTSEAVISLVVSIKFFMNP
jgi:hypothetical protein